MLLHDRGHLTSRLQGLRLKRTTDEAWHRGQATSCPFHHKVRLPTCPPPRSNSNRLICSPGHPPTTTTIASSPINLPEHGRLAGRTDGEEIRWQLMFLLCSLFFFFLTFLSSSSPQLPPWPPYQHSLHPSSPSEHV